LKLFQPQTTLQTLEAELQAYTEEINFLPVVPEAIPEEPEEPEMAE